MSAQNIPTTNPPKRSAMIVSGYFSPLHVGHLDMMEEAKRQSDVLVVIVNNNAQQEMKKGKIIIDEADRLRVVEAMSIVDHALIAIDTDRTVSASLEHIANLYPDHELTFANGGDRVDGAVVPESSICEARGIQMVFDMGGNVKADSSSRINVALGLEEEMSAPPSATT